MMRERKNETNWHRGNVDGDRLAAETTVNVWLLDLLPPLLSTTIAFETDP
jgi:hypothetical protein